MVDSYVFTKEDKHVKPRIRKPLEEMPIYDLDAIAPIAFDAIDTADNYDISIGKDWIMDLAPGLTLVVLKKMRSQVMSLANKIQKEIDRISLLELPYNDPRTNTPYPRYYELRARKERE